MVAACGCVEEGAGEGEEEEEEAEVWPTGP